ncbi:MAG: GHKL domain-containing protein [Desulfobacteraceae bacterium]|nr:GHKL domain-containing protein [Desulfobacteraceae bacterium]
MKILTRIVNFIFWIILPAIMAITIFVCWTALVEPQMRVRAEYNSRIWAHSNAYSIATVLDSFTADFPDRFVQQTENFLYTMLMLKDPETEIHFILGVKLEMDYDVINVREAELDIAAGETSCDECFVTEISLHSTDTKELMGYATFYHNGEFYRRMKDDMKSKLLKLSGIFLACYIIVCGILTVRIGSIIKAEDQIQKQHTELAGAERLRTLGEIATGIAHELNQPLTIIRINAGYLKDGVDAKRLELVKKIIIKQIEEAADIISNMINYARPLNNPEPTDIRTPINSALGFFNERFGKHAITFAISLPDDPPGVAVNPLEFQQIVTNLLSNAYNALEKKSEETGTEYEKKVDIRLFHDSEKKVLVFELQDNGPGMGKETRERCLEPFYTTDPDEGTGLGLYITKGITEKYKMKMEIDSTEGLGTAFRISMPVT